MRLLREWLGEIYLQLKDFPSQCKGSSSWSRWTKNMWLHPNQLQINTLNLKKKYKSYDNNSLYLEHHLWNALPVFNYYNMSITLLCWLAAKQPRSGLPSHCYAQSMHRKWLGPQSRARGQADLTLAWGVTASLCTALLQRLLQALSKSLLFC